MMNKICWLLLSAAWLGCSVPKNKSTARAGVVIVKNGFDNNAISADWKKALVSRMDKEELDSFSMIRRPLTVEEENWKALFESRTAVWNQYRDSLGIPFRNIQLNDSIFVMTGFLGNDDAFTFQYQTVCFDLTAFAKNYGVASLPENQNRADRIFSHEYTHLLHKSWARKNRLTLASFADSVKWECLYEGIGMYRSLSAKYLPKSGPMPQVTQQAMQVLTPVFVEKMSAVLHNTSLTDQQKRDIQRNLSRGPVDKKWGAFTVGVWLWLEANGNEKNLASWIDKGPDAVILLAKKYLDKTNREKFDKANL